MFLVTLFSHCGIDYATIWRCLLVSINGILTGSHFLAVLNTVLANHCQCLACLTIDVSASECFGSALAQLWRCFGAALALL
jgi:hypothetical protein